MYQLKQSQTARPLLFLMLDSNDHTSGKTGLSPTVTLSKNGGSFASPAGAVTEIANGWYKVAGNATDTATLGPLVLHATGSGADPCDVTFEVVAFDPHDAVRLGLTGVPNAAAGAVGGLPLAVDASGRVDVLKVNGTSQTAADLGGVLAALSTLVGDVPTNAEFAAAVALLATNAQLVKVLAAVYDTATRSGSVLTLSNGATQTIASTGRTTAG